MIPGLGSKGSAPRPAFACSCRAFALFWCSRSVLLRPWIVLCSNLALPTSIFARPDSPRDALDVVFGGRNETICKISGERAGYVASNDFSYDFCVFSQWFFNRLSAQFSITSSIVFAFDGRRSCWLKPCKTLAGATKIKVRR